MIVRGATMDDAMDVLDWRNDPLTRQMSRSSAAIDKESHLAWFAHALESNSHVLLIAAREDRKIGMVRFDLIGPGTWEVSINLNPLQRSKGYSRQVLAASLEVIFARNPNKVMAEIRHENEASRHLFEQHGFQWITASGGFDRFALSGRPKVEETGNVR